MKKAVTFSVALVILFCGTGSTVFAQEGGAERPAVPPPDGGDAAPPADSSDTGGAPTTAPPTRQPEQTNPMQLFLPLFLMIAVMYLVVMRPQRKQQKKKQEMVSNIRSGDRILTNGGIVGTIRGRNDNLGTVTLEIAKNVRIELNRNAIATVLDKDSGAVSDIKTD